MIGTAAALLGSAALTAGTSVFNSMQNYSQSKKMMKKQYQYNMKQWNAQNEYNLPTNQMKRLADAGLNPHLVYGNGGATPTASLASSASPGRGSSDIDFGNPLADLAAYQGVMNQKAVEDNTRANSDLTREQQHQLLLNGEKSREVQDKQIELMNSQILNNRANASLTGENAFTQGIQNAFIRAFTGDNPRVVGDAPKSMFDRTFETIGSWLYDMSGYKGSYLIGTPEYNARLF